MHAVADGATSKATIDRARAIYGSRIARLAGSDADTILAEKNAFTLFTTGAYRSVKDKETVASLKKLSATAIASAKSGDSAGAQAAVKDFIKVGEIRVLDTVDGAIFNPKQRRNAGAPPTSEIEAQVPDTAIRTAPCRRPRHATPAQARIRPLDTRYTLYLARQMGTLSYALYEPVKKK